MDKKIDNDFFEIVVIYNMLTDSRYLGSVVDCLEPRFFKNNNISKIVEIINDFFLERNQQPTITEVKSKLVNDTLKDTFKNVVAQFKDIDTKFNQDELYENTEKFLIINSPIKHMKSFQFIVRMHRNIPD